MFIELVDSLRCLTPHEDTWLVAGVTRMDGRHIIDGTLGCPVCRREYPIVHGVAWFSVSAPEAAPSLTTVVSSADERRVARAGALLGLSDAGGIVTLAGSWIDVADAVADFGAGHVVVLNAEAGESSPQEVSSLVVDDRLPFGMGSLRAAAFGRRWRPLRCSRRLLRRCELAVGSLDP